MSDKKLINKRSITITLEKVSYKDIGIPKTLKKDSVVSSRTIDSYEILDVTDKNIDLRFLRNVFFIPKAFMEAYVQMRVNLNLTNQERKIEEEIKSELEKRKDELLQLAICNASVIISTITSISMASPIITPPFFVEEKDDNTSN